MIPFSSRTGCHSESGPTQDACSFYHSSQKARSSRHLRMWNGPLGSAECAFTHGRLVATCAASTPQSEVFLIKHPGLVLNKRTPAAGLSSAAGVERDDLPAGAPAEPHSPHNFSRPTEPPTLTDRAAGDVRVQVRPVVWKQTGTRPMRNQTEREEGEV